MPSSSVAAMAPSLTSSRGSLAHGVPLGIIPFGTGNVLAQNLKVPKDPVAAAHWILRSRAYPVPLGKITCCVPGGRQSWLFAMAAGMGMHAALMSEARRSGKSRVGRAAYFAAGGRLLLNHPVQPFDIAITTTGGSVVHQQVSEAIALRVAELNRWRPGGGLTFPFLRLATVAGYSRSRLARATYEALFRAGGARDRAQDGGRRGLLPGCGACGLPPDPQSRLQTADRGRSGRRGARRLLRGN